MEAVMRVEAYKQAESREVIQSHVSTCNFFCVTNVNNNNNNNNSFRFQLPQLVF